MQPFSDSQNTPPRQNNTKQPFLQKGTGLSKRRAAAQYRKYVPKGGFIKDGLENQSVAEQPKARANTPKKHRALALSQGHVQTSPCATQRQSTDDSEDGAELQSESTMVGVTTRAASKAPQDHMLPGLPSTRHSPDGSDELLDEDELEEFKRLEDQALRGADELEGSTGSLEEAAERLHLAATRMLSADSLSNNNEGQPSAETTAGVKHGSGQSREIGRHGVSLVSQEHLGRLRSIASTSDENAASKGPIDQRSRSTGGRASASTVDRGRFQQENKATTRFIQRLFHPQQEEDDTAQRQPPQQAADKRSTGGSEAADGAVLLEEAAARASELKAELKAVKDERTRLLALKAQVDKATARLEQDRLAFEQSRAEEAAMWEKRKQTEEARLKRERRALEQQSRAVLKLPTRKERSEVEALEAVLEKERQDGKAKEARHKLTVERLRRQIVELQGKISELHKEVRWHEEQRLAEWESSEGHEGRAKPQPSVSEEQPASGASTQPSSKTKAPQRQQRSWAAGQQPAAGKPLAAQPLSSGPLKPSKPPGRVVPERRGIAASAEEDIHVEGTTTAGNALRSASSGPCNEPAKELPSSYQVEDFETVPSDETLARMALPEPAAQPHSSALPQTTGTSGLGINGAMPLPQAANWDMKASTSHHDPVLGIPVSHSGQAAVRVPPTAPELGPASRGATSDILRSGVLYGGRDKRQPIGSLMYSASPMSAAQQARLNGGQPYLSVGQGALGQTGASFGRDSGSLGTVTQSTWAASLHGASSGLHSQAWSGLQGNLPGGARGLLRQFPSKAYAVGGPSADQTVQERRGADGKLERTYADGSQAVTFSNGTLKREFPDGSSCISFTNGDIKKTTPAGIVEYFYAEVDTWHTTHPAGQEVFFFPSGQVEAHHPDGTKEIIFCDGSVHRSTADGREEEISMNELSDIARQPRPEIQRV